MSASLTRPSMSKGDENENDKKRDERKDGNRKESSDGDGDEDDGDDGGIVLKWRSDLDALLSRITPRLSSVLPIAMTGSEGGAATA